MFIIGWVTKMLLARGVSQRAAGPLSWVMTGGAALLIAWAGWSLLKHSIISRHDMEQRAEQAERQLERAGQADKVDSALQKRDAGADQAVKKAIDDAVEKDANHGAGAAGPVSNAATDELRKGRRHR